MRFAARLSFLFLLAGCYLFAGTLAVVDPSFENPTVTNGWHYESPYGWVSSAWTILDRPLPGDFSNLPSPQIASSGTFYQNVGPIVGGTTYRVTVWVGNRPGADGGATYSIGLLAFDGMSTTSLGSVSDGISTIADGTFQQVQLTAFAGAAYDGQQLRIELSSSGYQANFDEVSLSDAPEPATVGLLALGGGLLALLRRRR